MKKAIVALLLTAMTVASLGGCGSKDSNQSGSQNAGATNADASNSGSADCIDAGDNFLNRTSIAQALRSTSNK